MNGNLDKRAAAKRTFALEINQRDEVISPPKLKVPAERGGHINSTIITARVWARVTHRSFISLLSLTVEPRKWPCAIRVACNRDVWLQLLLHNFCHLPQLSTRTIERKNKHCTKHQKPKQALQTQMTEDNLLLNGIIGAASGGAATLLAHPFVSVMNGKRLNK
jgi:hypothetical protein